jgi:DNA-binding MarR family transcriptional regulator
LRSQAIGCERKQSLVEILAMSRDSTEVQAHALRQTMQRLVRRFGALAAEATPCGKPLPIAHAHALMILELGPLTQQALGAELAIDKSNVARLCAKMAEAGHVVQAATEHDGRSRTVALTAKGRRLAAEVGAASRARFGALLKALPPAQRANVIDALRHLVDAVDVVNAAPTTGAHRTGRGRS